MIANTVLISSQQCIRPICVSALGICVIRTSDPMAVSREVGSEILGQHAGSALKSEVSMFK
jgi:hypothetical protein